MLSGKVTLTCTAMVVLMKATRRAIVMSKVEVEGLAIGLEYFCYRLIGLLDYYKLI